jgi:DNA-binding MarR family transcriptional regulator
MPPSPRHAPNEPAPHKAALKRPSPVKRAPAPVALAEGAPANDAPTKDAVDHHVARWAEYWKGSPSYDPEVEGAVSRMQAILREKKRRSATIFADSEFTHEDYATLHALMIQPYPTEATPAQLAEASKVSRAAMTSRLDRLATAGYITRVADDTDRRRIVVRPTSAGRLIWDRYVFEGMAQEQQLLESLTVDELQQLNALLRKVVLSFEE